MYTFFSEANLWPPDDLELLLQFFNAFCIAFQNLTYVQNPSYPTVESGSTAMSCVYVVNAVASAPGKKNQCQIVKINNKKLKSSVYETESFKVTHPKVVVGYSQPSDAGTGGQWSQWSQWSPPIFGRSVNTISTMGGRFCTPFTNAPPKFFHLLASLRWGKIPIPMVQYQKLFFIIFPHTFD